MALVFCVPQLGHYLKLMTLDNSKPQKIGSASCGEDDVNRRGPHSYPRLGSLNESFTRSFAAKTAEAVSFFEVLPALRSIGLALYQIPR